jgi:serine/threonine protein phosphatase PrpC
MQLMIIESYGISDIGLSRANNEDVWAELPDCNFYVLADGMGGHQAGEVAAKEAVMEMCDAIDTLFAKKEPLSQSGVIAGLHRGIIAANTWVRTLAKQHPELSGMGTTLCCFCLFEETLIYAHVGDSRIYRFRKKLTCLTADHSVRQENKSMLTQAIGTSSLLGPEIATAPVVIGDIYFLCSDGLTDYVADDEIETILQKSTSLKDAAIELVETAKAAGGNDNITILMIKLYETDLPR